MSDEIVISSTSDTQEAVNQAAGITEKQQTQEATPVENEDEPIAEEATEKVEEPRHPLNRAQKRINELTRTKYDLQDRLDEAVAENARLKGKETKETPVVAQPDQPTRPKPSSIDAKYKTFDDYVEDLGKWSAEQVIATERKLEAQKVVNERLKTNFDAFNQQVTTAREKYEDWDEIMQNKDIIIPTVTNTAIMELPNGAEVLHLIGTDKDVRDRLLELNKQSDFKVVGELWRISDWLETQSDEAETDSEKPADKPVVEKSPKFTPGSAKRMPVSTAPAPLKPVGGNATRGSTVKPDELPYQDYKKWRKQHSAS